MFKSLLPKTTDFVAFFEEHAALTVKASQTLLSLSRDGAEINSVAAQIKELEHAADKITHSCLSALQRTFITNFDRGHIQALMHKLDDVMDSINDAASRLALYEIKSLRPETAALFEKVHEGAQVMLEMVHGLRNLKAESAINETCIHIHRVENEADDLLRSALKQLFTLDTAPLLVIKWKEIFEHLERATDRCEDVADIVLSIVVEAS